MGRVKPRDNPATWGTDNEAKVRSPEDTFFKKFAAECSRVQIAIDVFSCWCAGTRRSDSLHLWVCVKLEWLLSWHCGPDDF